MSRFDWEETSAKRPHDNRQGFLRSEDGSLIIFSMFVFLMMLIVGGIAVDVMRYETQRTRLQATLDRAVLAAASLDQKLPPEDVVQDYFVKAGLGQYLQADMVKVYENDELITDPDDRPDLRNLTHRRVDASGAMKMGTTLLRLSGIDSFSAPAAGSAEETNEQLEVSLVLDTSGSMGSRSSSGSSKISELRRAATQFVNMLLCDPAYPNRTSPCIVDTDKTSITLVPYSEQVLVGEDLLQRFNPTEEHTYSSCVNFQRADFNTTAITTTQQLQREGHIDPWSGGDNARSSSSGTCRTNSWREITPATGNAADLRSAISSLGASGYTSIDIGMKWGTAFLDPAAKPVVSGLVAANTIDDTYLGRPYDFDERGVAKVVVLMTDGQNTNQHYLYDGFHGGPSPLFFSATGDNVDAVRQSIYNPEEDEYYWLFLEDYRSYPQDRPYGQGDVPVCTDHHQNGYYYPPEFFLIRPYYWNAFCTMEEGHGAAAMDYADLWATYSWSWWEDWDFLPKQGHEHYRNGKDDRLSAICEAAKDQDMIIYTIGFELRSSYKQVMRDCASGPAFYYEATGGDISAVFKSIAREITKLKLVN